MVSSPLGFYTRELTFSVDQFSGGQVTIARKPDLFEALMNLGTTLQNVLQIDLAVAYFRRALSVKPNSAQAMTALGGALILKGETKTSIDLYRKAIQVNPDYALAHYNLAFALNSAGRKKEAAREFAEAHRLNPKLNPPEEGKRPRALSTSSQHHQ
jgi:tetratricopeptide (TPR) repeat protein